MTNWVRVRDVQVKAGNGAITLSDVTGTVELATYNGAIKVAAWQGNTISRLPTERLSVDAQTDNGDIVMGPALPVASAIRHNNRLSAVIGG